MGVFDQLHMAAGDERSKIYDPVRTRRKKLASALLDQMHLLGAVEDGGEYRKVRIKRARDLESDEVVHVEQRRRVTPWWWFDDAGGVRFSVRYGSEKLELKEGMDVVVLTSTAQLKKLLPSLRKEVLSGGLDGPLDKAAQALQERFGRKK